MKDKQLRLADETCIFIENYAKTHGLRPGKAVDQIIKEYALKDQSNDYGNMIADIILEKAAAKYKNLFTRLRLGLDYTDKNVQILMEAMNSLLYAEGISHYIGIKQKENPILTNASVAVKKRIEMFKQRKDNNRKA